MPVLKLDIALSSSLIKTLHVAGSFWSPPPGPLGPTRGIVFTSTLFFSRAERRIINLKAVNQ